DRMIAVVERDYVPRLSEHLAIRVMGTPATNERYCAAPLGNAYGSALTPENVSRRVAKTTPLENLWLVNPTAGFPSIGGMAKSAIELVDATLTSSGDRRARSRSTPASTLRERAGERACDRRCRGRSRARSSRDASRPRGSPRTSRASRASRGDAKKR